MGEEGILWDEKQRQFLYGSVLCGIAVLSVSGLAGALVALSHPL